LAETYGWLFVNFVPLLYEEKRVAKQLQIETWLNLWQLVKTLKIEKHINKDKENRKPGYIV
jgi:hypothetical protein